MGWLHFLETKAERAAICSKCWNGVRIHYGYIHNCVAMRHKPNNIKDGGSGLDYLDLNVIINSLSLRLNSSLILSIVD